MNTPADAQQVPIGSGQILEIARITRDPDIQPRDELNTDTVSQYSEAMQAGVIFPEVVVYYDVVLDQFCLSQGFHRCAAAIAAGMMTITAEIREGTREDALWDAAGSNQEYDKSGLRRSNKDKRRAVRLAILARPKASARDVAKQVGVSPTTVSDEQSKLSVQVGQIPGTTRQVTRGGSTYTMQTGNIGGSTAAPQSNGSAGSVASASTAPAPTAPAPTAPAPTAPAPIAPAPTAPAPTAPAPTASAPTAPAPASATQASTASAAPASAAPAPASPTVVGGGEADDDYEVETEMTEKRFNSQKNKRIEWAKWSWNPVTGCNHGCVFCYARDIANRFFKEGFEPTFHPQRLDAPRNTHRPRKADQATDPVEIMAWKNVFVCSMADLFGKWVPDEWIEQVFDSCRQSPEWNYLFLTKYPLRYIGLDFPPTAWVGTSVVEQKWVANAERAFAQFDVPIKWLSVEPMLEPIVFNDLSMWDWIVIGGQTRSTGAPEFHPDPWWVIDLAYKAREAGCKVYFKDNTFKDGGCKACGTIRDAGWRIKEYPLP